MKTHQRNRIIPNLSQRNKIPQHYNVFGRLAVVRKRIQNCLEVYFTGFRETEPKGLQVRDLKGVLEVKTELRYHVNLTPETPTTENEAGVSVTTRKTCGSDLV